MATILIVDDVSAHRTFLIELLRGDQHRLLEASNGAEGLAAIADERPDLVITDVLMPVMDGYELVRRLRADPLTSTIPVLFYTSPYGAPEARAFVRASAVPFVLTKPARADEVVRIIGQVLAGEDLTELSGNEDVDLEYLRLLTYELSDADDELRTANARLRALVNVGLELSALHDSDRLIDHLCDAAHDLFGASYVTLGFIDPATGLLRKMASCGVQNSDWIAGFDGAPGMLAAVVRERRAKRALNPGGDASTLQLPPGHPPVHAYLAAPICSPRAVYGWICLVKNDGTSFSAHDEQLIMALAGQGGRIYEIEHEVSERRAAEAALRAERDRAQLYLDTADVVLLALDTEARVTMINRTGCDLLGWSEAELHGRDWIETIVAPAEQATMRRDLVSAVAGGLSALESTIVTRSGAERRMEWRNITRVLDAEGGCVGVFGSVKDVTLRVEAIDALHSLEERKSFALESANIGIWDSDIVSGELRWSAILEAQYGLAPGAFSGTFDDFAARIHPDDREAVLAEMALSTTHGGDFQVQHRVVRPGGEIRWLNGAGRTIVGAGGQPVRAIGVSMDVTERRILEGQFQQAQKMEAVGRLAGGVAHDFNNLLTAILGYCGLLLADMGADDSRTADIEEIQKAGLSAAALTHQLLAFSRKEIIVPTLLDLNAVIEGMRPMLERLIGEDVRVVLDLQPSLSPIRVDRSQLEQVIMNLALNARDAMPTGGRLTLGTSRIEFDEADARTHIHINRGAYAALTVSDTGSGMTSDVLAHLFEPFFTTKEVGKGTGLGLSTVHGIALQSGGAVQVDSMLGEGTSITVFLPRVDGAHVTPAAAPEARTADARFHTVLVVEDSDALRQLTRRLLERQGYNVLIAANAEEATALVEQHATIDVLLTDVVMPGASGPELTRRLLELRPDLRVIFMSGYTDDAIVHHGALDSDVAFLAKPFTRDSLTQKVHDVLVA